MTPQASRPAIVVPRSRRKLHAKTVRLRCDNLEDRTVPALFNVQTPLSFTGLNNNGCVASADLNKDGYMDAVLTNFGTDYDTGAGNSIKVLYGKSGGGFNHSTLSTGGKNVAFVSIADINGDSWPDAVVANANQKNTGSVSVFANDGFGNLALVGTPFSTFGNNTSWVGLHDITGDNVLDAVVASFGADDGSGEDVIGQGITIFAGIPDGNGNGTFAFQSNPIALRPEIQFIPTALAVADFNGDGIQDIAAAVPGIPPEFNTPQIEGVVYVFRGTGSGGFAQFVQYGTGGSLPVNIQAADLNGDSKPDLIVANAGDPNATPEFKDNSVGYLLNNSSPGSISFGTTNSINANSYGTFAVAVADFNIDGKADIAAVNYGTQLFPPPAAFVSVYLGSGSGMGVTFNPSSPGTFDTGTNFGGGQYLAVGDYDQNGSPDLIVAHATNKVGLLLNTSVTAPAVTINQAAGQADPTNSSPITFTVQFSEVVTGFDGSDISFTGSTVGGTLSAQVIGAGQTYTVTVTGMSGTGTVQASIPAGAATNGTGTASLASTSTDNTVTFDGVAPTVTINQAAGQADPANTGPINFTVVFSENVTGFTSADVDLSSSSLTGLSASVTQNTPSNYTVAVTGMSGIGTVVAKVVAGAATDAAGNTSAASTSTDNSVTFNSSTTPTVTINQAIGQADPTNASPISFTVRFSESVTGFSGSDVQFTGSTVGGTLVANVSGSGQDYTVTVTGMAGAGTVVASIPANAAQNGSGVGNTASTSTDNSVSFDGTAPTVTINQAVGQSDPTTIASVQFDVKFSENVTGFDLNDVSLTGSTAGGTLSVNVTGSLDTYVVTVTGMTTTGGVVASIPAGGALDAVGNANLASTSTDNSVLFQNINNGVIGFTQAVYNTTEDNAVQNLTVTVTRTGGVDGAVSINYGTSDSTAISNGSVSQGQSDYNPTTGTLSWADGEGGDKTFTIPINPDTLNEGKELFNLSLSNLVGSAGLGLVNATVAIAPSDGQGQGLYLDQDGDKVRIRLNGKTGAMQFFRTDPDGDGRGPIELIELTNTLPDPLKPRAVLAISVVKSKTSADGGTVGLGAVTGSGLRAINARKANLNMEGVNLNGYLGSLVIGNVVNGADIQTLATANPKQKTRINALKILDGTSINIGAGVSSLVAASFGVGSITAPRAGNIIIRGDMSADVNITGAGVSTSEKALTALRVKGVVSSSDINVNGNVGAVVVGAFRNSRLFAGYTGADNGTGAFNLPATVNTFRATYKANGFLDSRVIAAYFKSVTITNLVSTNPTDFGFYADVSIAALKVIGPTTFVYDPTLSAWQGVDDFEVRIV